MYKFRFHVLIVFFLFKEGLGVFDKTAMEEGFVIAVNKDNPVNALSSEQIKNIYDQKINSWSEVGGKKDSVFLFRLDDISNFYRLPRKKMFSVYHLRKKLLVTKKPFQCYFAFISCLNVSRVFSYFVLIKPLFNI